MYDLFGNLGEGEFFEDSRYSMHAHKFRLEL